MRYYDEEEAKGLNAEQWQIDLLNLNPSYCSWGPHEDYMWQEGDSWDCRIINATWAEFGPWELNELNECVNFYFEVSRTHEDCTTCAGKGTHPDAQWISESWYSHSSPFQPQTFGAMRAEAIMRQFGGSSTHLHGFDNYPDTETLAKYGTAFSEFCEQMRTRGHWNDDLTQDEVQALVDGSRLFDFTHNWTQGEGWQKKSPEVIPTAAEVNAWQRKGGLGHDSINRWIAVKRRCERLGVPHQCPTCEGSGYVYTEPAAHVSLVLWWLHPRKGCSRGIKIERVEQTDLPAVYAFLTAAAARNAGRFNAVAALAAIQSA